jgi:chromosome partitioning protein
MEALARANDIRVRRAQLKKDLKAGRVGIEGILATMYDSRTLHSREVLERVTEAFGDDVLETVIGRTIKFPDASVAGQPILTFASEHRAAGAYRQLARELVARGSAA